LKHNVNARKGFAVTKWFSSFLFCLCLLL